MNCFRPAQTFATCMPSARLEHGGALKYLLRQMLAKYQNSFHMPSGWPTGLTTADVGQRELAGRHYDFLEDLNTSGK